MIARRGLAGALLLIVPARVTSRSVGRALLRSTSIPRRCSGAATATAEKQFLINNDRNDVAMLQCATLPVLRQGLAETDGLPQICFAGESNAGKSSLVNHLLRKKGLAKASSVAGKTRSVDMMLVNDRVVLTDLPGLPSRDGQVTELWESTWRPLILQYISRCPSLLAMVYVHDVRWKVSSLVREFLTEVREEHGLPVLLVLTKDDRIVTELRNPTPDQVHAERERLMQRTRKALNFEGVHLHYSTDNNIPASRKARRNLLRYVESLVAAGTRDECTALLSNVEQRGRPGARD